jgi:hypothetical protein
MIHRLAQQTPAAVALQNAAELRRFQAATPAATRFNFAQILSGTTEDETEVNTKSSAPKTLPGFSDAIATAAIPVVLGETGSRAPVVTPTTTAPATTTETTKTTTATTTSPATATDAAATASPATTPAAATVTAPGVGALVTAILNGSFQPTDVTNPAQLQAGTPIGNQSVPNFYFASDQTAAQLAALLGGKVVQMPPFGQDQGWTEPNANFIQLPNGQTFNAADVAYYANTSSEGAAQLTADITATINQGSAWTSYYQQGGAIPTFPMGYVGPPISGMTYASGMIGADGNVINPAMVQSATQGA